MKRRSRSENMRKFFCHSIARLIIKHGWQVFGEFTRCAKVCGLFFLDCAFWMLIGWADKLRSRGYLALFVWHLRGVGGGGSIIFEGLYTGWNINIASCSGSTIVAGKISTKYNKYMMISRHSDKFKECFELLYFLIRYTRRGHSLSLTGESCLSQVCFIIKRKRKQAWLEKFVVHLSGTMRHSKVISRSGLPSWLDPRRSSRTGSWCKTCGFIWRLCLSEETSLNNCLRSVKSNKKEEERLDQELSIWFLARVKFDLDTLEKILTL